MFDYKLLKGKKVYFFIWMHLPQRVQRYIKDEKTVGEYNLTRDKKIK